MEEFLRADLDVDLTDRKMVDVQHIFYQMEPRTLTAAYKFFCEKELDNAHSAAADIEATIQVLQAQLKRYPKLGTDINSVLSVIGEEKIVDYARRFVYNDQNEAVFNFGKFKGKPVVDVLKKEPQYYDWMMKGDFPKHTKKKLTELFNAAMLKSK